MEEPVKIIDKEAVEKTLKDTDLLSVSAAFVNPDGTIIPATADGDTDTEINPNTVYSAASLSKPVFAYLVLKLIEANHSDDKKDKLELGKFNQPFDLDTPLYDILPIEELNQEPSDVYRAKKLTARMILSQRSGLPITHHISQGPLKFDFEPNTEYGYSGVGFAYLQKIIDKLTGSNLQALAQKYVFGNLALKMNNSTFISDENKPLETQAANSLQTTAMDYAKFVTACMRDQDLQIFDPVCSTDKQVLNMTNDDWGTQLGVAENDLKHIGWSLVWGLELDDQNKPIRAYHTGDMNEWRAFVAINLENNTAIVYFSKSKHIKEDVNGFILSDQIITPHVELKHVLPYFSQKFGFPIKIEENWRDKEKAQYERIGKYVTGCDICLIKSFSADADIEKYINKYIFSYDTQELRYIHSHQNIEIVKVDDFDKLSNYIDNINTSHAEIVHLSSRELRTATTSTDTYTVLPHLKVHSDLMNNPLQDWAAEATEPKWKNLQEEHTKKSVSENQKTNISESATYEDPCQASSSFKK